MTKRRDILKNLRNAAKAAGLTVEVTEGGRHTIVTIDGLMIPVPRHNEIKELTTTAIYKEAADKLGKDWWKK
ncbi:MULTISPECIES: hypothetical protein [Rhodococcus]|uniref:hypothetical protein n=1 Tax=Rhodococcus TaxID=1827 RepID=UPI00143E525D|nr:MULTISPECIES: hypothetical protein [Rhodococcus]QIX48956.1 hypothetical protein HFP48_04885 [Rhodococcus sp. DMU1]QRI75993.1 hypothetical protein JQ505_26545 [Rhodococcus aetherivorans]QSE59404.1 hypothetical protein JYA75_27645 [Rhodococcus sp. PSBB066]QSE69271.1 hypothetical protein JYA91_27810 [Rhodococcus sp. PSBB049]